MSKEIYSSIVINNAKREKYFSKYATKSYKATRRAEGQVPDKANIRPAFFHDADRIIHSMPYTRYIDKTQVFFLFEHDHITHRSLHVQFVSKIARVIGRCLRLNEDLIEAIALGHDLGHSPFGHDGETILNDICMKHNIGGFSHGTQSVRLLMELDKDGNGLNLTLQVLDGILCHNGEILNCRYEPSEPKRWEEFEKEYQSCMKDALYCKKLFPMTLEGCVVRIADVIAYVGRDIEDAITIKLVNRTDVPKDIREVLGESNERIIDTLVMDLIKNSYGKPYIEFSNDIYRALRGLIEFNYKHIYNNPQIKKESHKVRQMFKSLYAEYKKHIKKGDKTKDIYEYFLKDMNSSYQNNTPDDRKIVDYIAGMTDDFFYNQYKKIFVPSKFGYSVKDKT